MSYSKKYKIGVIIISSIIISFIFLYNKAFYQKITLNNWTELSSEDFKGAVKPFSKYSATIYYDIEVEYDTLHQKYISKAVQKDKLSWMRKSARNSSYLLKHEQYHFNIAEYHSRVLNMLYENKPPNEDFKYKLDSILKENYTMQALYDSETDHSLIKKEQYRWENKIDSLLDITNKGKINHHLLSEKNFESQYISIEALDTIREKYEVFISGKKDSIYNQSFRFKENKIDTVNSEFYTLNISKTNIKYIYQGVLTLYNKHYKLKIDSENERITEFHFFEQNKDSVWISEVKSESSNQLKFKFENYYNDKLYGMLTQLTLRDTIIDKDSMITISNSYLIVTNKVKNSDFYIKSYDFDKERIFSLKGFKIK